MRIGFIGAGTITKAVIEGLERAGKGGDIVVSHRSEAVSTELARRFPRLRRATNAEVAASSDIVFLAVRPTQVEEALSGVSFGPQHTLVSFVSGLSVDELARIATRSKVGRVLPLPSIARGEGPILCYPAIDSVVALFEGLGDLIIPGSEAELRAMGSVSGFMSTYFELQNALIAWLVQSGVPADQASLYVRAILRGLSGTGYRTSDAELPGLPLEHETKGGLNQRVRQGLKDRGWFDQPAECFREILNLNRASLK